MVIIERKHKFVKRLNHQIIFNVVKNIHKLKVLYNVINVNKNFIFKIIYVNKDKINLLKIVLHMISMKMYVKHVIKIMYYHQIDYNVFKKF